jgi:hypothetical protein
MRRIRVDIRHTGFTLMVENPLIKQKSLTPNQIQEVIERYARDHGMTTEKAATKARVLKWIPAAVSLPNRFAAHDLQRRQYPNSPYRIVGARANYTPLEVKKEREGERA